MSSTERTRPSLRPTRSKQERFTVSEEHVALARAMVVGWQNCEYGAPEIDPKRPYGNSDVERDIAENLKWEIEESRDGDIPVSIAQRAAELHREMETALQIFLRTGAFEPGEYVADEYRRNWRRAAA